MVEELNIYTSWEYRHRHVMFVGFEDMDINFMSALDSVLETSMPSMAGKFNRPPLNAFHTAIFKIRQLIPQEVRRVIMAFSMDVVAVWNCENVTEIYLLSDDPDEEVSHAFMDLSSQFE